MKFSIKDFIRKCDQIHSKFRIWSHLLKKPVMENVIFCAVNLFYSRLVRCSRKKFFELFAYENAVINENFLALW